MIDLIITDFDGVLVDSKKIIYKGYVHMMKHYNLKKMSRKEFDEFFNVNFIKNYERLNLDENEKDNARKMVDNYCKQKIKNIKFFKNIIKTFNNVPKPIAIATSSKYDYVEMKMKNTRLWDKIVYVAHFKSVNNIKPNPESVIQCLDATKISKDRAVFIGDTVQDIKAGKAAGVRQTVAVSWGFEKENELKKHNPDYIAKNPKELEEILIQWTK